MSRLTPEQKLKLHDRYIGSDCRIEFYTLIEHFEFGQTKEQIEKFFDEINRIERTHMTDSEIGFYQMQQEIFYRPN